MLALPALSYTSSSSTAERATLHGVDVPAINIVAAVLLAAGAVAVLQAAGYRRSPGTSLAAAALATSGILWVVPALISSPLAGLGTNYTTTIDAGMWVLLVLAIAQTASTFAIFFLTRLDEGAAQSPPIR